MKRKRNGFIPLGDVAETVELPGGRAMTHRAEARSRSPTQFVAVAQPTYALMYSCVDAFLRLCAIVVTVAPCPF